MADPIAAVSRAPHRDVVGHRAELLTMAAVLGLQNMRIRPDGALVVTASDRGYRNVAAFSARATSAVGAYIYVVTDDTPGADLTAVAL